MISTLAKTFTPESFIAHLQTQSANVQAKEQRAAERSNLLAELPRLAAAEQRLVKRIGQVEDDSLVAGLKVEWSEAKVSREQAERRVAELEGIERDLQADQAEIESLVATWKTWSATLAQTQDAVGGSVPAEAQAHQILKKVLVGTIKVTPAGKLADLVSPVNAAFAANEGLGDRAWTFLGYSRFNGILAGGLLHGLAIAGRLPEGKEMLPISGGSDAGVSTVASMDGPPKPPALTRSPGPLAAAASGGR